MTAEHHSGVWTPIRGGFDRLSGRTDDPSRAPSTMGMRTAQNRLLDIRDTDSTNAGAAVVRALRESSILVPVTVSTAATGLTAGVDSKNPTPAEAATVATRTAAMNMAAAANGVALHSAQ